MIVEEPSSPSDGSDNEMESDEGSDRLATSSAADYVCIHCKSTSKHTSLYLITYLFTNIHELTKQCYVVILTHADDSCKAFSGGLCVILSAR